MQSNKPAVFLLLSVVGVVFFVLAMGQIGENKPKGLDASLGMVELGVLNEGYYPWEAEAKSLKKRLQDLSLPALTEEGTVLHTHQHLDIYINGEKIDVPSDIGINKEEGFISPIHTHDLSGVIHVESPTVEDFTLGQFFGVWGVRFNKDCIGAYCAGPDNSLKVYVNGEESKIDPDLIVLAPYQEIVIV